MFFIQDRIQAPHISATSFLAIYFISAAFSFPLWLEVVKRLRLTLTWLIGMALSVAVFIWAVTLREGDALAYAFVCAATGVALGADLVVPGTLLTGVIQRAGDAQQSEGRYLGWWQVASKLNLALAAGVGLPALSWLGYTVGTRDENALLALTWIYAGLPCLLKLLAALLLYRSQSLIEPLQPSGSPA
jgi:Na+/melibiose symporter-like transporter